MLQLLKNKQALMIVAACTAGFAFAHILEVLAYITLNSSASQDFATAFSWIDFLAALGILYVAGAKGWEFFLKQDWKTTGELAGVAVSFLIISIGYLVAAVNVNSPNGNYSIAVAVGIGLVALLLLYKAAEASLAEQGNSQLPKDSKLWFMSCIGVLLVAIGKGVLTTISSSESIASGILMAIGFGLILAAVSSAYKVGRFTSIMTLQVIRALSAFIIFAIVMAIAQGWEFNASTATLTGMKIAGALPTFIYAVGYGLLAYGGWGFLAGSGRNQFTGPNTPELSSPSEDAS